MSDADRCEGGRGGRTRGTVSLERLDVRALALLGVGWAALGVIAAVIFALVVAPLLPDLFLIELTGRGTASSLEVATDVFVIVQLVCAALTMIASIVALVVGARHGRLSVPISALVSIATPLAIAVVLVNGIIPAGGDVDRAGLAFLAMLGGAILGAGSFFVVVRVSGRTDETAT